MFEWSSLKCLQITNVGEDVEKWDLSYTIGRNVNWCSHYGNTMQILEKLKIDLPQDPAIPLLSIYLLKKPKTLV